MPSTAATISPRAHAERKRPLRFTRRAPPSTTRARGPGRPSRGVCDILLADTTGPSSQRGGPRRSRKLCNTFTARLATGCYWGGRWAPGAEASHQFGLPAWISTDGRAGSTWRTRYNPVSLLFPMRRPEHRLNAVCESLQIPTVGQPPCAFSCIPDMTMAVDHHREHQATVANPFCATPD